MVVRPDDWICLKRPLTREQALRVWVTYSSKDEPYYKVERVEVRDGKYYCFLGDDDYMVSLDRIKKVWNKDPNFVWHSIPDERGEEDKKMNNGWKYFLAVAIILACMGLWIMPVHGSEGTDSKPSVKDKYGGGMELRGKVDTGDKYIKKVIDHNQKVVIYFSSDGYMVACPLKEGEE